jgi:hypothetical protein
MKWQGAKALPLTRSEINNLHKQLFDIQKSGHWEQVWKDIRDFINPNLGFFDEDMPNYGDRKDQQMLTSKPLLANNIQGAGMQDGITSPWRPWFRLSLRGSNYMLSPLAENQDIKIWCDTVTQIMTDIYSRSNFYDNSEEYYKELGAMGTCAMLVEEDPDTAVHFRTFTAGEYAIGTDDRSRINRFARTLRMPVAELVSKFGIDNVPPTIKQMFENKNVEKYFTVKHLIIPNPNYMPRSLVKWAMQYISFYWIDCSSGDDDYLSIDGYHEFPVVCSRWAVRGADVYGRGPGWYALADAKELQSLALDASEIRAKTADPPLVVPADVKSAGPINTLPGGITFYDRTQGGASGVTPLSPTTNALAPLLQHMQELVGDINQHFFVDLFRMLEGVDTGNITAREIIERVQEKMSQLGPVLTRLQHEFLQPVIDRVFNICMRNQIFPPPPDVLQGQELKIEYVSVLAQAQKMSGLTAIDQLTQYIGQLAQANPNALDKFDYDTAVDKYAEFLGTPPGLILSTDQVQQMRQQRQQQQAVQQAIATAEQGAKTAQTLSQTPVGQNSALDALIPGAGGYVGAGG